MSDHADTIRPKRVNVEFKGEALEALQSLSARRGKTVSDVLRDALALLKWAHDQQAEGYRFVREDANGKETEVVFL